MTDAQNAKGEDAIKSEALAEEAGNLREWLDGPGANLKLSDRAAAASERAFQLRVRQAIVEGRKVA